MDMILIDDNKIFADELCRRLCTSGVGGCTSISIGPAQDVATFAKTVVAQVGETSVVLINVNLKIGEGHRQDHQGTELLAWLRIKGVMNHCLLYSFQSLEGLVRGNPTNMLLLSKGASFVHLPDDLVSAISDKTGSRANRSDLKKYLRTIFNVGQFRHRDANWWSVKVLWDVHKVAKGGKFRAAYPEHVKAQLAKLNNAVGVYLHGLEVADVKKFIEEKRERLEALQVELANRKADLDRARRSKQEEQRLWQQMHGEVSKTINEGQQAQLYAQGVAYEQLRRQNAELRTQEAEALDELDQATRECDTLGEELLQITSEIDEIRTMLSALDAAAQDELFDEPLPMVRKSRILLIDDNADNGWEDIFKVMLNADVKSVVPPKKYKHDIDGLYRFLEGGIVALDQSNLPSVIFLDLRLFDETGRSIDVENVSGKLLLSKIRQHFKCIPIVITTASNKMWTFRKLVESGADAYWVKEGLDELRSAEDSVRNYTQLMFLMSRITDGRYDILREIYEYSRTFDSIKWRHWSRHVEWRNGEVTRGNVEAISDALNQSVYIIKNYLHNYHLKYGFKDERNEAFILSGVINKMAGVYEAVHDLTEYHDGSYLRDVRGDKNLGVIKWYRNQFSHLEWATATWDNLVDCFRATQKYLDTPFA